MSETKTTKPTKPRVEAKVDGVPVELPSFLEEAVIQASKGLLSTLPTEMTTNQAADFLDVSRPYVIKLIRKGELPCRLVGKHRRIPAEALVAYRTQMCDKARQAADEMTRIAQEAGLYDILEPPSKRQ